ncbi:MAG: response regulator [Elusimicrobia bacterium]|nr:response regulator [Elusimicrobiota bacterium]
MAKILVIDDEELLADLVAECLRDAKHEVSICLHSSSAEEAVLAQKPDLAIIDYQMPGKTGVQLLADLRKPVDKAELLLMVGEMLNPEGWSA